VSARIHAARRAALWAGCLTAAALTAALAPARPLAAQPQHLELTRTATFGVNDQSLWSAGSATVLERSYSLSRNWNRFGGFNAIVGSSCTVILFRCVDTRTGFALSASTYGNVGFEATARVNSGSLDGSASARARLILDRPSADPQPGQVLTLKSALDDQAVAFSTQGPSVQARAVLSGRARASMTGTGCFIGVGCASSTSTLIDIPQFTQELASYNWNGSGTVKLFGQDVPGLNFGEPFDLPGVPGASFTLYTPQLDVAGASGRTRAVATARTDVARLDLDPLQLAVELFSPAAACVLSCSLDAGPFSVGYTLFSATLGPVFGLRQELDLSLARPFTRFDFNTAVRTRLPGAAWGAPTTTVQLDGWTRGLEVEYARAAGGLPLTVSPTYGMVGSLRNRTYLTVDPSIQLSVLEAEALGYSIGPLYSNEWRWNGLSFQVFDGTFDVPMGTFAGPTVTLGALSDAGRWEARPRWAARRPRSTRGRRCPSRGASRSPRRGWRCSRWPARAGGASVGRCARCLRWRRPPRCSAPQRRARSPRWRSPRPRSTRCRRRSRPATCRRAGRSTASTRRPRPRPARLTAA
jgi:hypothetical protein